MILVVGSTGFLGIQICRLLCAKGESVRALVRSTSDQNKTDYLKSLGIELVYGDLKDQASLNAACQGVNAVITTATSIVSRQPDDSLYKTDQEGQLALVNAARASGVAHFVYISISANIDPEMSAPLTIAKRAVERSLQSNGLTYTIIRPSFFMESWLSPPLGFDYPNARVRLFGSGKEKISFISLADVAKVAVEALVTPAARNAIIELGGPESLSPLDIIREFEAASGSQFEVQHIPVEAIKEQITETTEPYAKNFAVFSLALARGDEIPMQKILEMFPIRLTSIHEYVQNHGTRNH